MSKRRFFAFFALSLLFCLFKSDALQAAAVSELKHKAESGDANSQFQLGVFYAKGPSEIRDITEAIRWFRMAAEQGEGRSQYNLGVIYERGIGVEKNPEEALKWFKLAANQGLRSRAIDSNKSNAEYGPDKGRELPASVPDQAGTRIDPLLPDSTRAASATEAVSIASPAFVATGNARIDSFFDNLSYTERKVNLIKTRLQRVQAYILLALTEPEQLIRETAGKDLETAQTIAQIAIVFGGDRSVHVTPTVLNILKASEALAFINNTRKLIEDTRKVENDVKELKSTLEQLTADAKALPAEAKSLGFSQIRPVISRINEARKQLSALADSLKVIIEIIPDTIVVLDAVIRGEEKTVVLRPLSSALEPAQLADKSGERSGQGISLPIRTNPRPPEYMFDHWRGRRFGH